MACQCNVPPPGYKKDQRWSGSEVDPYNLQEQPHSPLKLGSHQSSLCFGPLLAVDRVKNTNMAQPMSAPPSAEDIIPGPRVCVELDYWSPDVGPPRWIINCLNSDKLQEVAGGNGHGWEQRVQQVLPRDRQAETIDLVEVLGIYATNLSGREQAVIVTGMQAARMRRRERPLKDLPEDIYGFLCLFDWVLIPEEEAPFLIDARPRTISPPQTIHYPGRNFSRLFLGLRPERYPPAPVLVMVGIYPDYDKEDPEKEHTIKSLELVPAANPLAQEWPAEGPGGAPSPLGLLTGTGSAWT